MWKWAGATISNRETQERIVARVRESVPKRRTRPASRWTSQVIFYSNATVGWVCMLVKVNRVYAGGGGMLRWCNKGLWKELKAEYMV